MRLTCPICWKRLPHAATPIKRIHLLAEHLRHKHEIRP